MQKQPQARNDTPAVRAAAPTTCARRPRSRCRVTSTTLCATFAEAGLLFAQLFAIAQLLVHLLGGGAGARTPRRSLTRPPARGRRPHPARRAVSARSSLPRSGGGCSAPAPVRTLWLLRDHVPAPSCAGLLARLAA